MNRESWLENELFQLRRDSTSGDFTRRLYVEMHRSRPKEFREAWKSLPKWFRDEAGKVLGGKFEPKQKVSNNRTHSDSILEAIKSFTTK